MGGRAIGMVKCGMLQRREVGEPERERKRQGVKRERGGSKGGRERVRERGREGGRKGGREGRK